MTWPESIPRPAGALRFAGKSRLTNEFFAGITLAALSIPLNIGYAESAGLPPIVGINAAVLPVLVFAVLSGSRHLVVGPDATIAALLVAILPGVASSSGASPEELAIAMALLTGVLLIGLWALRAGSFVRFISKSVLVGFLAGLGIEVLTSQVEKILNIEVSTAGWITDVVEIVKGIPDASLASVVVGVTTIVLLRLAARFAPRLPAPLIALVLVGGAVAVFDPDGVALLGEIPSGLPALSWPSLDLQGWADLLGTAMAIAVLTIAEGLMIAGSAARRHQDELDANGELFAMGAANLAAAVTSGMPIGASASRAAAVESAGSRSQTAGFVSGLLVVVVVLFLTDVVGQIPSAALAGLVANAVVSIIEVRAFRTFARLRRTEFYIALGCTAGVLLLGPIGGLVLAMLATMVDMVRRISASPVITLHAPPTAWETQRFTSDDTSSADEPEVEGLVVFRFAGPLFFANADAFRERIESAQADPSTEWIVLDFEAVTDVDPTAGEVMEEVLTDLADQPTTVIALTRVSVPVRAILERYDLLELIGERHVYQSNRDAFNAFLERDGAG